MNPATGSNPDTSSDHGNDQHAAGRLDGHQLLALARQAIATRLEVGSPTTPALQERALTLPGACFVTLTRDGRLRGCIGSLEAWRPLAEDLRENALAAAFRDPRFPPVSLEEWPHIRIEVSILKAPHPLPVADEAEALTRLVPGRDGVILRYGRHCATFLPQVWEALPEPRTFLAELKRKAGLAPDFWAADLELSVYAVHKWKEGELP